jgi:hypothetical protein
MERDQEEAEHKPDAFIENAQKDLTSANLASL